jgi:hypothetical protein
MGIGLLLSQIALWLVLLVGAWFMVGMLRQIGLIRQHVGLGEDPEGSRPSIIPPSVTREGPPIGSRLLRADLGMAHALEQPAPTLVLFLTAMCESCHRVASYMSEFTRNYEEVTVVVVLGDSEMAVRSFEALFPMDATIVQDSRRERFHAFGVRSSPFGLLYDGSDVLIRKAILTNPEMELDVMVHGSDSDRSALIYPVAVRGGVRSEVPDPVMSGTEEWSLVE